MIGSVYERHVRRLSTLRRNRMMAGLGMLRSLVFLIFSLYAVFVNSADDLLVGCGGFVKSDVEIDYSLVEVTLIFCFATYPELISWSVSLLHS